MHNRKLIYIKSNATILLAFILFLITGNLATAQDNSISLEKSKAAALEYSNNIKNGNLKIEEAELIKKEAASHYLPTVSAVGAGIYGFDDIIGAIPPYLTEGISNMYLAGVSATEVIYAGGKINNSNKLAQLQIEVNKIRAGQAQDSVLLLTEQKYWKLVQVQEQQKVLLSNEKYLDELLKQQQDLLDEGLIARNQLLRVKVERSKLLLQKSRLENARKIVLLDFSLYTGIPYDTTLLAIDTFNTIAAPELKYVQADSGLENNSNYQLLEKSMEASKLQTAITKGGLMPTISIGLGANQFGTFDGVVDGQFLPVAFGTISIPISDWWGAKKQKVNQKEIHEKITVNEFKDGEDKLRLAITKSWYDLSDAYKQIEFAQENIDLAEENLRVSRDNYNSGLSSLSDLLDAQRLYQQAETELVTAYANYEDKEVVYLYRTNQLSNQD